MKLIVGLGNPGIKYDGTLHNVGFAAIDALAEQMAVTQWSNQFKSLVAKGRFQGYSYILLKPQTFMNLSGEAVLACRQFFKLEREEILVLFDDVDREAGTLRYRASGGHGGHNGLRSIIQTNGGNDFHRIKIGIGRPPNGKDVASYVLSQPPLDTRIQVEAAIEQTRQYQLNFIQDNLIQIQP